jgi:hypothetical protein
MTYVIGSTGSPREDGRPRAKRIAVTFIVITILPISRLIVIGPKPFERLDYQVTSEGIGKTDKAMPLSGSHVFLRGDSDSRIRRIGYVKPWF